MQNNNYGKKQNTTNSSAIRNKRLMKLFSDHGYSPRLIGRDNPQIVLDNEIVVSCRVKGFDLEFLKSPHSEQVIRTIRLKRDTVIESRELDEILSMSEHQTAYKITHVTSNLQLVGYNFINREDRTGRYPVFAKENALVFTSQGKVEEEIEKLVEDGYQVIVSE